MYDKLKIWQPATHDTQGVSNHLDAAKVQTDIKTGETDVLGGLCGLKVTVNAGGITVTGSLSKLLYPNNIYPLDRRSTARAFEKLADMLHYDFGDARVLSLEFGNVFVMSQPVERYLSRLGTMPRMLRLSTDANTLYYQSQGKEKRKVIVFYDKKADAMAKGMELPPGFGGYNLLKYEIRLNGRLTWQTGWPTVTASTLHDRTFYRYMLDMYKENYFAINKINQTTNAMESIKTVSDAYDALLSRLAAQCGQTQVEDFLNELKAAKVFKNRIDYTRLRQKIQAAVNKGGAIVPDELVRELNDDILTNWVNGR